MADHTPGPWITGAGHFDLILQPGPSGRLIAYLAAESASRPYEPGEAIANARLIAAAPDLLAACKAIEPHIASDHPVTDNEHPYLTAVRQLRAAIAKAEGGTACLTA